MTDAPKQYQYQKGDIVEAFRTTHYANYDGKTNKEWSDTVSCGRGVIDNDQENPERERYSVRFKDGVVVSWFSPEDLKLIKAAGTY